MTRVRNSKKNVARKVQRVKSNWCGCCVWPKTKRRTSIHIVYSFAQATKKRIITNDCTRDALCRLSVFLSLLQFNSSFATFLFELGESIEVTLKPDCRSILVFLRNNAPAVEIVIAALSAVVLNKYECGCAQHSHCPGKTLSSRSEIRVVLRNKRP